MHDLLSRGFAFNYASCMQFFDARGTQQQWLAFTQDMVATFGPIGTGLLSLNNASQQSVEALAIGTAATYASIDVVTRQFLFGAENVTAVKELIGNALVKHSEKVASVVNEADAPELSFEVALISVLDNQAICLPRNVARFAKEAIAKGKVTAATTLGDFPATQDQIALQRAGTTLGMLRPLDLKEAKDLIWFFEFTRAEAVPQDLIDQLSKLTGGPYNAGKTPRAGWADIAPVVRQHLATLSPATLRSLRDQLAAERDKPTKQQIDDAQKILQDAEVLENRAAAVVAERQGMANTRLAEFTRRDQALNTTQENVVVARGDELKREQELNRLKETPPQDDLARANIATAQTAVDDAKRTVRERSAEAELAQTLRNDAATALEQARTALFEATAAKNSRSREKTTAQERYDQLAGTERNLRNVVPVAPPQAAPVQAPLRVVVRVGE